MSRFKSISFFQNRPKIKLFLQKNTKFLDPETAPRLQISGYMPAAKCGRYKKSSIGGITSHCLGKRA